MNLFELQHGRSRELQMFPHIVSTGSKKNNAIQLESFLESMADFIRIYHIIDGKYEWQIGDESQQLYPGDTVLILPGRKLTSVKGFLEIGTLAWVHLRIDRLDKGNFIAGEWSSLTESERHTIGNILLQNKSVLRSRTGETGRIFVSLRNELLNHEIGYYTRVNQLLDEIDKAWQSGKGFFKDFFATGGEIA
jgi:hypothetical protein